MDQIFKGGGRSEPDPAALLKYEFASAPTKVDDDVMAMMMVMSIMVMMVMS